MNLYVYTNICIYIVQIYPHMCTHIYIYVYNCTDIDVEAFISQRIYHMTQLNSCVSHDTCKTRTCCTQLVCVT